MVIMGEVLWLVLISDLCKMWKEPFSGHYVRKNRSLFLQNWYFL